MRRSQLFQVSGSEIEGFLKDSTQHKKENVPPLSAVSHIKYKWHSLKVRGVPINTTYAKKKKHFCN